MTLCDCLHRPPAKGANRCVPARNYVLLDVQLECWQIVATCHATSRRFTLTNFTHVEQSVDSNG